jgi:hypothetical protein
MNVEYSIKVKIEAREAFIRRHLCPFEDNHAVGREMKIERRRMLDYKAGENVPHGHRGHLDLTSFTIC